MSDTNVSAIKPAAKKAAKKDAGPVAEFEVISPLTHDGVSYAVGDLVELTEDQAATLLGHTVKAPA